MASCTTSMPTHYFLMKICLNKIFIKICTVLTTVMAKISTRLIPFSVLRCSTLTSGNPSRDSTCSRLLAIRSRHCLIRIAYQKCKQRYRYRYSTHQLDQTLGPGYGHDGNCRHRLQESVYHTSHKDRKVIC